MRSLFLVSRQGSDADILEAARQAGVEYVVLVSSITAQTHPHLAPAGENLAVEKLLKESGMAWTILRPTQFASNAPMWAATVRKHETVHAPYADAALPTIHPADIASVARVALTVPGHKGRTYALTGPEPVTARQQVETIGTVFGQKVPFAEITRQQAHTQMAAIFGAEAADAVLDVMGGDVNEELMTVRDTVSRITDPGPAVPAVGNRERRRIPMITRACVRLPARACAHSRVGAGDRHERGELVRRSFP